MISLLREFTKSPIFTLLMALLIVSFAVFGLRDVFSQVGNNVVLTAGSRSVSDVEFKQRVDRIKQQQTQQGGKAFTNQEFVDNGYDVVVLNQWVQQEALLAWLDKLGVKPSAKLIVQQIAKEPAFFNAISGKFDKATYRQVLQNNGFSEKEIEDQTSDQIAASQYFDAAVAGLKAPRIFAATNGALMLQSRDASVFLLSPKNVAAPPKATDADIAAFYKDNSAILARPEIRQASVVQFTPDQFADAVQVSDDDLHKAYNDELATLANPETRSFTEITAPDAATAAKISAALKAGGDPNAVASANKGSVIPYADKSKADVPDGKIAAAAFAMQTGDISGAVQGDLGYAVIKMGDIKAGTTPTFDSERASLLTKLKQDKAADKLNQVVNDFQKAHEAGEDFAVTAQRLGLKIAQLEPLSADGKVWTPDGDAAVDPNTHQQADASKAMPPQILKDIFDLSAGGTSDVEELGNNMYAAVRVDVVRPAGLPPMTDSLKAQLAGGWMQQKMGEAVSAAADEALQRLNNGEDFAKVAASLNAPVQSLPGIDQQTGSQKAPQQVLSHIFTANPGEAFEAPINAYVIAVGRVDAVHQSDANKTNSAASTVRSQLTDTIAQDFQSMTQTGAAAAVKTRTFPVVAERALDVTPKAAAGKSASASASKAKS